MNISAFTEILNKRAVQIENEKKIDSMLDVCYKSCPNQVHEYIMKMRELNRQNFNKVHSSSIFSYKSVVNEVYNTVEKIQNNFWINSQEQRNETAICKYWLPRLNKELDEIIKTSFNETR